MQNFVLYKYLDFKQDTHIFFMGKKNLVFIFLVIFVRLKKSLFACKNFGRI